MNDAKPRGRAELLGGAAIADQIKQEVARDVERLMAEHQVRPCLATVLIGDDPASAVYVRNKIRACEEVGIRSEHHALPATTSAIALLDLVTSLNTRDDVDGILVQLPLPTGIDEAKIIEAIDPAKDVDAFHPVTIGRLAMGRPTFVPCTPAGIIELLDRARIPISGANACVVESDCRPSGSTVAPAERCHGYDLPFANAQSASRHQSSRYSGCSDWPGGFHWARAHKTGRNCNRCWYEQGDR